MSFRFALSGKIAALLCTGLASSAAFAQKVPVAPSPAVKPVDLLTDRTLFLVGYSHLDTEWNWAYPQTIREYLPKTLHENFALFEKYPDYVFNWTGANRYRLMQEYYPADYATLKKYVAAGRWFPAGSSLEEGDACLSAPESIIRQVLYGNEFFRREFGTASNEYMLPDCFGFPASLPTILAHCGLQGFSTQKLTKSPKPFIPFNFGNWVGVDGSPILAELNAGSYHFQLREDLSRNKGWLDRLNANGGASGIHAEYQYYGVGDTGGSVGEESVPWLEKSLSGTGPVHVVAARGSDLFAQVAKMPPTVTAKLPTYQGDLLLTQHSAGSASSQATVKRWNRQNELLADSAERASVAASLVGGITYPMRQITDGWLRFLPAQCHDILAGTCTPECYTYTLNDEVVALNEFADALTTSVGGVARNLDTRGAGIPLVVYNPLSVAREDIVEATVALPGGATRMPTQGIRVVGPDGAPVPAQIVRRESDGSVTIAFLARVPSVGFATYHVQRVAGLVAASRVATGLTVSASALENARYRVTLDANGDVAHIYDKTAKREILSAPVRLAFQAETPAQYPAWNMDWSDQQKPPRGYVDGPATVRIVENGPARVALQIERRAEGSRFVQTVRLAAGAAGDRIEFANQIDWRSQSAALKAVFPLTVANPNATYNWGVGTVQRSNNHEESYESPSHDWFDLTQPDGSYGVSVLNQAKFGSDKPDDNTLRLTLLYTPGTRGSYKQQTSQDWGRHEITYAHVGDWRRGDAPTQAARFNQRLIAFQTSAHAGALGKTFSLVQVSSPSQVQIATLKKAENSNAIIVRLFETVGVPAKNVRLTFAAPIVAVHEVNGQEQVLGEGPGGSTSAAPNVQDRTLTFDMASYRPRAFAVTLGKSPAARSAGDALAAAGTPLPLPYNTAATAASAPGTAPAAGGFDGEGRSFPAEMLPAGLESGGVRFTLAPATGGSPNNAVACQGQKIALPPGSGPRRVYLLAAAIGGDVDAAFQIDGKAVTRAIPRWDGFVGQWDNRQWKDNNEDTAVVVGLTPGYVKRTPIAWYADHRRLKDGANDPYHFCYLFRIALDLPPGAKSLTLPDNPSVRLLAATLAANSGDDATPTQPLYDTLADHAGVSGELTLSNGSPP